MTTTTTAPLGAPIDVKGSPELRPDRSSRPSLATVVKYLVSGVLGVLVVIYIGPSEIGEMLLKIVVALAISTGLFVGANKLFDLTYDRWTTFSTIAGFAVGVDHVRSSSTATDCSATSRRVRGRGR